MVNPKTVAFIFSGIMAIPSAHAQLVLEKSVTPREAALYVRSIPWDERNAYKEKHGAVYVYEDRGVSSKPTFTAVADGHTEYAWRFRNQEVFYSSVDAFRTDLEPPPLCRPDAPRDKALDYDDCDMAIRAFVQCHLFIFDTKRHLVAVQPLEIPQPDDLDGKPSCFDVYAMAPAQVVKDGMLIVAGYHDSRWTCSNGPACAAAYDPLLPDPLYKTTFLVRFDRDVENRLVLSQDDRCLPPLNSHATIASARQALREAGCK